MLKKTGTLAVLLLLVLGCAQALAAPATVGLRVEGSAQTPYEGLVTTDGREVTTASGGTHICDGTNGGANPSGGPTMTTALDDAAHASGFSWDGTWSDRFKDFFITRIADDTNTGPPSFQPYWGLFVNWVATSTGGCQTRVNQGDRVQFLYSSFGQPLLELGGVPARVVTGQSFTVGVTQHDGGGGSGPAAGASVAGALTGVDGGAAISFDSAGVKRFKATRADAVRSNAGEVCVYDPGSSACEGFVPSAGGGSGSAGGVLGTSGAGGKDSAAPLVSIWSLRDGARYRRGPRLLRGSVREETGLEQVFFRLRRTAAGGCSWFNGRREDFTRPGSCGSARYVRLGTEARWSYLLPERLERGRYLLEVKAFDRAFNAGRARVGFRVLGE